MTAPLAIARPDGPLYRISRRPDAWAWPDWSFAGEDGTFGNRYDDPDGEYRVLYASGQRLGAFLETLARYRRDPALIAAYRDIVGGVGDQDFPTIEPGAVPIAWLERRCLGTVTHAGGFADIGHSDSLAHLRIALAPRLLHYGLDDLDAGDVRRRASRKLTQELSRYVFEQGHDRRGRPLSGVRYLSRLGDDLDNWAIFEGHDPQGAASAQLDPEDPDLLAALAKFDLVLR